VVLLPPPSDAAGSTPRRALASMLPTWTAMCRRGARPATAVTWTTVRTPSVMESDAAMPMLSHPATLRVLDAGEAEGLRDVRFAWPSDMEDPIPVLRELRQHLLTSLVAFQ
ncbi:MAG: hypothetical protein AB7K09_18445, partial [Planctomycetota bacterium]